MAEMPGKSWFHQGLARNRAQLRELSKGCLVPRSWPGLRPLLVCRGARIGAFVVAANLGHACLMPDRPLKPPGALGSQPMKLALADSAPQARGATTNAALRGLWPEPQPIIPELTGKVKKRREQRPPGVWSYVLPIDYGIRNDSAGSGRFRAPRRHGSHNGVDLLAPVGTPVFSPCNGSAQSGVSPSFGVWVHVVCPVPNQLSPSGDLYASIFYAHLDESHIQERGFFRVARGKQVGKVGKTGNASSARVTPHLHLEIIVHESEGRAKRERHRGYDQSTIAAAEPFFEALRQRCLLPHGLTPDHGRVRRARRVDPFLVLTCLTSSKPTYSPEEADLKEHGLPWSKHYFASGFDIDEGPRHFLLAQ